MRESVDIIIPTYDNFYQLNDCLQSMAMTRNEWPINFIIVNNGTARVGAILPNVKVIETESNLGWVGGLREGLKHSTSKYVVFANDDIFIPRSSSKWLYEMVRNMEAYPSIGAIGPSSNVVMGMQRIWEVLPAPAYRTSFLIGFCMLVRRKALDEAGGVQDMECGGDDIDLSIRIRKAGYDLLIRRDIFVYHHGFQTGNRIHGDHTKPNGWNSQNMTDNTNMELIRKHGFLEWWDTIRNTVFYDSQKEDTSTDVESIVVSSFLNGEKAIVELGCGAKKTVDKAIGVDIVPKGVMSPHINAVSVADIVADVEKELPFDNKSVDCFIARHIIEHVIDPIDALTKWGRCLRDKGKIIISCPDERFADTVPMNPEHKHAFTPDSLSNIVRSCGFGNIKVAENYNGVSFTLCMEKI